MKFKVWDDKLRSFLSGEFYFIDSKGKLHYLYSATDTHYTIYTNECHDWIIPVFSTGKTDKNGVEWHDGEILTYIKEKRPALHGSIKVVVFHDNTFRLQCELCRTESRLFKPEPLFSVYNMYGYDFLNDLYSIGNKFENPELMESP